MTDRGDSVIDWSRWLLWVLATALGTAIGLAASPIVAHSIGSIANLNEDMLFGIAAALLLGILTGNMQWFVLKRHISRAGRWAAASIIGYIAALILSSLSNVLRLGTASGVSYDGALMAVMGASLGLPQYWVLRQHFPKAGWWVLASGIGMLSYLIGGVYPAHNHMELVLLGAIEGAIFGGVTGIALVWLLRSPRSVGAAFA